MKRDAIKYLTVLLLSAMLGGFLCAWIALATGCGAFTRIDPPKAQATVTTTEYDQAGRPTTTTTERVDTQGPGGQSSGDAAAVKAEGEAPTAETPKIKTGGGKTKTSGSASIARSSAARWTVGIIGFLMLIGGAAGLYLRQPLKAAAGTAIIGIGLMAAAIWIDLAEYILAGLALYAAGSLWLTGWDAAKFREALRAVAAGVSDHVKDNPATGEALLERIGSHAEERDKAVIREVRTKDRLNQ
jgi:hypothetical protein